MAGKTVLIVHDDALFVEQVKESLRACAPALRVSNALSAPRALGMVAADTPDVIVVDAELMGVDGYALTQQLKTDPKTKDVPVIIVTLSPSESSALRARQAGASAHLSATGPVEAIVSKISVLAGDDGAQIGVAPQQPLEARVPQVASMNVAPPPLEVPQVAGAPAAMPAVSAVATAAPIPSAPPAFPNPAPAAVSAPGNLVDLASAQGAPVAAPAQTPAAASGPAAAQMPTVTSLSGYSSSAQAQPQRPSAGYSVPLPPSESNFTSDFAGADGIPHIDDLLRLMLQRGGSDLHITVGSPPGIRQRGEIVPVDDVKPLTPRDTMEMILGLLSEEQRRRFETELELDFAYSIPGVSRFRANVFQQRNSMGAVFRVIPIQIPTLEDLALPKVCRFLAERPRGLVLVTGPTGSGKSTTLAAMLDHINANRPVHIITLEDPIEFMHRNKKAYINQREVGEDTHSFASALKRVLRQDPDVILVGEMRDLETISAAITAAETGHLVLATLHTTGGPETVDRVIDVFPPHQQQQVRMQLSTTLEGVLSQTLLRSTDGRSRVMAMEIMLGIPAISNLIREGKTHQMETIIQGGAQLGMQTLDQHLKTLLNQGKVTFEEAIAKAKNPRELANMVGRKL
ncbi:MAG TPA: PilT/PilU family type 4a pilus ATPase [Coriobacteriia bacterium]|nr:PilT/PilU family type 4a pilus ATPase [Coriobacteriia bacterium]